MKKLRLTVTAQSPLAIGRKKPGGSVSEVETYIPGSVLRGAIASHIIAFAAPASPTQNDGDSFHALFTGSQPVIFQNAYPAIAQIDRERLRSVASPVQVMPATAVTSKTDPGFTSSGNSGVFDTLIDRFCAEQVGYPYEPTPPDATAGNDQVEAFGGCYSREKDQHYAHPSSSRFLTRVGISRRRAVAADQILYSVAVLNESFLTDSRAQPPVWEPVTFTGEIVVPDDELADLLLQFINRRSQNLRVGSSRSRGLGKVSLEASEASLASDLPERIQQFNKVLKDRRDRWSVLLEDAPTFEGRTFFTIDLQSDAILTERWRSTTVLSPEMLKAVSDAPTDTTLQLHAAYSSYDYRSGWNSAWGLMKDQSLVTNKGSTYLFSTAQGESWMAALEQLERVGIGDRTPEGFGQVSVCHEFHQIMRENPA